jgi:hypothetical protein
VVTGVDAVEVVDVMEEVEEVGDVDVLAVVDVVVVGVADFPQEAAVKLTAITKAAVIKIFSILSSIFSSLQALLLPST